MIGRLGSTRKVKKLKARKTRYYLSRSNPTPAPSRLLPADALLITLLEFRPKFEEECLKCLGRGCVIHHELVARVLSARNTVVSFNDTRKVCLEGGLQCKSNKTFSGLKMSLSYRCGTCSTALLARVPYSAYTRGFREFFARSFEFSCPLRCAILNKRESQSAQF